MNIVTEANYKRMEELNLLLKNANIDRSFTIKTIDDGINIGVKVRIPSIISEEDDKFLYIIFQEPKRLPIPLQQTIDNINMDLEELFKSIKPDIVFMLGLQDKAKYKIIIKIEK